MPSSVQNELKCSFTVTYKVIRYNNILSRLMNKLYYRVKSDQITKYIIYMKGLTYNYERNDLFMVTVGLTVELGDPVLRASVVVSYYLICNCKITP